MGNGISQSGIGFVAAVMIVMPIFMCCVLPCLGLGIAIWWKAQSTILYGYSTTATVTGRDNTGNRRDLIYQYRHDITEQIRVPILKRMLLDEGMDIWDISNDIAYLIFAYLGSIWHTIEGRQGVSDRLFFSKYEGDELLIKVDKEDYTCHQPQEETCSDTRMRAGALMACVLTLIILLNVFVIFPFLNQHVEERTVLLYVMIVVMQIIVPVGSVPFWGYVVYGEILPGGAPVDANTHGRTLREYQFIETESL